MPQQVLQTWAGGSTAILAGRNGHKPGTVLGSQWHAAGPTPVLLLTPPTAPTHNPNPQPNYPPRNGGSALVAAHVVVQVQAAQALRVAHQLVHRRAAVHRAPHVLEGNRLKRLLQDTKLGAQGG